ncbi:hypothetical protein FRB98_004048 [Tulasnella sp. 332]|nr:hypothetical protein FRB98_004048 [Tulasnella sp. 332]
MAVSSSSSNPLSSSHAFIRALKSKDEDEGAKIDIATAAWNDTTLYIPGKNVVLVDWIFQQLSDDRNQSVQKHPLLDIRYWALLDKVISVDDTKTRNTWLTPILGQRPILPILSSLISRMAEVQGPSIIDSVEGVFQRLLPLATRKATADHLMDCLQAGIRLLSRIIAGQLTASVERLLTLMVYTFVAAFPQTKFDKKKVRTVPLDDKALRQPHLANLYAQCLVQFLRSSLGDWLVVLAKPSDKHSTLLEATRTAGYQILFSNEGIRAILDTSLKSIQKKVAPSHHLLESISTLLSTTPPTTPYDTILPQLANLLEFFILAAQKDGTNLSSVPGLGASDSARIKAATLSFVSQCLNGPLVLPTPITASTTSLIDAKVLSARCSLWTVLERHGEAFDVSNDKTLEVIKTELELALDALSRDDQRSAALMDLTWVLRMHFDSVEPFIHKILREIAICSSLDHASAHNFLSEALKYHSKTRTIYAFIITLTDCFTDDYDRHPNLTPYAVYERISQGPLFTGPFCRELQRSVSTFLTAKQIAEVIKGINDNVSAAWRRWYNSNTESSTDVSASKHKKKKQRIADEANEAAVTPAPTANATATSKHDATKATIRFALLCHFFSIIVPSMSLRSLGPHETLVVEHAIAESMTLLLSGTGVSELINAIQTANACSSQLILLSILRLRYSVKRTLGAWRREETIDDASNGDRTSTLANFDVTALRPLLSSERLLPELRVEILRSLIHRFECLATPPGDAATLSETVQLNLPFIETHVPRAFAGQITSHPAETLVSNSESSSAVIMWDMILTRWLHIIDNFSDEETLSRLATLLIRTLGSDHAISEAESGGLSLAGVTRRTLRSAHFWELKGLRRAVLASVTQQTAKLSDITASERIRLLSSSPWKEQKLADEELTVLVDHFRILLHFPTDYLTKGSRAEFVRRALALDVVITHWGRSAPSNETQHVAEWCTLLRTLTGRIMRDTASYDFLANTPDIMIYFALVTPAEEQSVIQPEWWSQNVQVTLGLLEMGYKPAARTIPADTKGCLKLLLEAFGVAKPFASGIAGAQTLIIPRRGLISLMESIVEGCNALSLPNNLALALAAVHADVDTWIDSQRNTILSSAVTIELSELIAFLEAVRVSVRYTGWRTLIPAHNPRSRKDGHLISAIIIGRLRILPALAEIEALCVSYTSLALTTLTSHMQLEDHDNILNVVAQILLLIRVLLSKDDHAASSLAAVASVLAKSIRTWSSEIYSQVVLILQDHLSTLRASPEALEQPSPSSERYFDIVALLILSDALLRHAPDGTYSVAQPLVTSWCATLAAEPGLRPRHVLEDKKSSIDSRILTYEALKFIEGIASERAMSLTNLELTYIWPILAGILSPSVSQVALPPSALSATPLASSLPSSSSLFSSLTNILISVMRQRRELLSNHLPSFTRILCLMMTSLRTLRDNLQNQKTVLGAKSREAARAGLPWWISLVGEPHEQLTISDSKAFGRVLTTLTAKTVGRKGFGGGRGRRDTGMDDNRKSESLAPVFSRHAAFVLISYIKTVTDSHSSTIPSSTTSFAGGAASAGAGLLTTLSRPTREALEEGVYTLCGLVGDHGRSWVLQSLNADGRVVLKSLWAEYEKQRYAGTG